MRKAGHVPLCLSNPHTAQREQNLPPANKRAERIADQHGVSHMTERRSEKFAEAMDAIAKHLLNIEISSCSGLGFSVAEYDWRYGCRVNG